MHGGHPPFRQWPRFRQAAPKKKKPARAHSTKRDRALPLCNKRTLGRPAPYKLRHRSGRSFPHFFTPTPTTRPGPLRPSGHRFCRTECSSERIESLGKSSFAAPHSAHGTAVTKATVASTPRPSISSGHFSSLLFSQRFPGMTRACARNACGHEQRRSLHDKNT